MDVNGDLEHAVWKKRAQRDDIVLRRSRKRVMVSDYAMGTWQITRETLRAAHQLYLKDKRDYTKLPARLRPPRELDLQFRRMMPLLTTYAGLLLRGLLDHFGGDVDKAIGAYNGGVKNPSTAYAAGVKTSPNTPAASLSTPPLSTTRKPAPRISPTCSPRPPPLPRRLPLAARLPPKSGLQRPLPPRRFYSAAETTLAPRRRLSLPLAPSV